MGAMFCKRSYFVLTLCFFFISVSASCGNGKNPVSSEENPDKDFGNTLAS